MRTLLVVVGVAVAITSAGCTTTVRIAGVDYPCRDTDTFKIVHAHSQLKVTPDCLRAPAGSKITLKFVNDVTAGTARTKQKAGAPMWVIGDNRMKPKEIELTIDPSEHSGAAYAFILEIDDYGTLDPRIVVQ